MTTEMKNILLLAFLLGSFPSLAQKQPLLSILTYSGDVTISGQPVTPGQLVYDDSKNLIIKGKESYVNILTETGYARQLRSGSYPPELINRESARAKPRPAHAVIYDPSPLSVITAPDAVHAKIFGDSVFLFWKGNYSRKPVAPFTVSLLNMFDDPLLDTTLQSSFCVLRIDRFFLRDNAIVFGVKSSQSKSTESGMHLVRKADDETRSRVQKDLQGLAVNTETERAVARIAIFEIHELTYDVTYCLYQLRMTEKASGVPIVNNYYQRLVKQYGLDTL